jgi:flavin-binding protein dodecin
MSKTFEVIERVGVSTEGITEAVKEVVLEANAEKKVGWFEVVEQRGRIISDEKVEFQVKVRIGRKLTE